MTARADKLSMRLSIHDVYNQLFKIWRRKRFVLFVRLNQAQHLIVSVASRAERLLGIIPKSYIAIR